MTTRTLEYVGRKNPHDNLSEYLRRLTKFAPQIRTKEQRDRLIMRATVNRAQRFKGRVVVLFGRDILSEDLHSIERWKRIPVNIRQRIASMPIAERERVISIPGLEHTYVWEWASNWQAEVTEDDYTLIMSQRDCLFRDPNRFGLYVPKRAYGHIPVAERITTNSLAEGKRILAERRPKNYVQGFDLDARSRS